VIATLGELTYGRPSPRGEDGLTDAERAALEATP
jgi:hypothetical protein